MHKVNKSNWIAFKWDNPKRTIFEWKYGAEIKYGTFDLISFHYSLLPMIRLAIFNFRDSITRKIIKCGQIRVCRVVSICLTCFCSFRRFSIYFTLNVVHFSQWNVQIIWTHKKLNWKKNIGNTITWVELSRFVFSLSESKGRFYPKLELWQITLSSVPSEWNYPWICKQ